MAGTPDHIRTIARNALDELKVRQSNPEAYRPISTGIPGLDDAFGGIVLPSYVAIGGKWKSGKTALATNIVNAIANAHRAMIKPGSEEKTEVKVIYFHLEETQTQFAYRMMTMRTNEASRTKIRDLTLTDEDLQELEESAMQLDDKNVWMTDQVYSADACIAIAVSQGAHIMVVDTFDLLQDPGPANEVDRRAKISHKFLTARNQHGLTTIVVYQLNEDGKAYGSRAIYRDCDLVMEVTQTVDSYTKEPVDGRLTITTRDGRQARGGDEVEVAFNGEFNRISPLNTTNLILNPEKEDVNE